MEREDSPNQISRRAFLRALGAAGGAALLAACGGAAAPSGGGAAATSAPAAAPAATSAPAASSGGGQAISLIWSDITNTRQPLIEDFTKATGIKVDQTI